MGEELDDGRVVLGFIVGRYSVVGWLEGLCLFEEALIGVWLLMFIRNFFREGRSWGVVGRLMFILRGFEVCWLRSWGVAGLLGFIVGRFGVRVNSLN